MISDLIDLEEIKQTEKYSELGSNLEENEINSAIANQDSNTVQQAGIPLSAIISVNDGDYTTSSTASPNISWSVRADLEPSINSYEVSIGTTTAGDDSVRSWENVGNVTSKVFDELVLNSASIYFVNVRAIDLSGIVSQISSSDGFIYNYCNALEIAGSWILVPGDSDYGTNDFCVMKYEAKNNSGIPSSQSSGLPWVGISQISAKSVCESLGAGYHLITNPEWMTIASNAANIGSNWSSGNVGDGELARGHSDKSPNQKCAADASDDNAYVQNDCSGLASGTFNQRRTHILSRGEKIWDLSGNVFELVDYYIQNDRPVMPDPEEYAEFIEITPTASLPLRDLIPTSDVKSYWNDAWDSSQSIGKYFGATNASQGVMLRGAEYDEETAAGLFYAAFDWDPNRTHQDVGFRCTFLKP
ncbi:MAG: hypothetical protein AB8G05_16300 [Oligoflexales bacterium]